MMSSFFTPRGAPHHSDTPRHPASARVLSLSLLLGLSPLAGITPAALAVPENPAQSAQGAPAQADPEQAPPASPAAAQEDADESTSSLPEVDESRHPEMEGFTVSPETLNITRGGTVTLTTPPLSAEFRQNYEFYEFSLVDRGSSYFKAAYARIDGYAYFGYLFDREPNPKQMVENPDGSYTFFLNIGPYIIEAKEGTLFDVILTYHKKGHREDFWPSEFRFVARAPINVVQDPKPTETTYIFSVPAIDDPWKDTTLTIEGFHILTSGSREGKDGPALLAFYEVDPKTGKIVGEPEFTTRIPYPASLSGERFYFLNWHFKTSITIPGGTLKPGKVYKIGFYGKDRPEDEKYPGELLNDVADFIPVRSLNKESASPEMFLKATTVSPYDEENILQVRAVGLKKQPGVSYRFSMQHVDEQGHLAGQKTLVQEIAAENIHDGTVDERLNVPGAPLNYDGSYRLFLEKVTAGKDGTVESVEQLTSKDLQLQLTKDKEVNAAWAWFKRRQVLPEVSSVWEGSNRRDVTVALYRLSGSPKVELPATSPYGDITPDDPDYAAYIWARQKGITFGWADGNFHPEAEMHNYSTAAFLYRYQRSRGKMSPNLPTAAPQPRNGSLPGSKDSELSTKNWATELEEGSAFWRESRWAVQQRIWGYTGYSEGWRSEDFVWERTVAYDLALMLYRMEHGGSHLK
ncbi:superoxide dismutase [Rothia mucilaginosa]|uniref:superoxide dismutase n=1 Tax=Rothia mucilaginosa TaxID=43675 RepID=UPI0028D23ABB|nr:superoxide dismutase [Rothia mucilaginosa]